MQTSKTTAPYIADLEALSDEALLGALSQTPSHTIGCVNWAKEFPYAPSVKFHIAHSKNALAVLFEVEEEHLRAVTLENNGPVWEDSCVELFIRNPKGEGYFNFEINCVGTALAASRRSRNDATMFTEEQIAQIRRIGSLPHQKMDNTEGGKWWLLEVVSFSLLGLEEAPESIDANLYKCGDGCQRAHFLSWSPIALPTPNFHCPEFFGSIEMAKSE